MKNKLNKLAIHDGDSPDVRLLLFIHAIDEANGTAKVEYVSKLPGRHGGKPWVSSLASLTAVEDFNVRIEVDGDKLVSTQLGESNATYSDGMTRDWQGRGYRYRGWLRDKWAKPANLARLGLPIGVPA